MSNVFNKVLFLTGGTGFIGTELSKAWLSRSDRHKVVIQSRHPEKKRSNEKISYVLNYADIEEPVFALVNLAGAPIADKRWSQSRKQELENSRIALTRDLIEQVKKEEQCPHVFINASAIGFYGLGDEDKDEACEVGVGYAASLCQRWELEANEIAEFTRLAIARVGVVIGHGGVLKKLLPIYRMGLGGAIGDGSQWFSWIHMDDVVNAILHIIDNKHMSGIYNLSSPNPVQQRDFASTLGKTLRRPTIIPTPSFLLSIGLGDMARELLLGGQKVLPTRLQQAGYHFQHQYLDGALAASV